MIALSPEQHAELLRRREARRRQGLRVANASRGGRLRELELYDQLHGQVVELEALEIPLDFIPGVR